LIAAGRDKFTEEDCSVSPQDGAVFISFRERMAATLFSSDLSGHFAPISICTVE
jgi:hypothetical protein